jgi:hypothetical protein
MGCESDAGLRWRPLGCSVPCSAPWITVISRRRPRCCPAGPVARGALVALDAPDGAMGLQRRTLRPGQCAPAIGLLVPIITAFHGSSRVRSQGLMAVTITIQTDR